MTEKECPSCAMEIDKKETVCPVCGYEFPKESLTIKWLAMSLIIIFVLYFLFNLIR